MSAHRRRSNETEFPAGVPTSWMQGRPARVCEIIKRAALHHRITPVDLLYGPKERAMVLARREAMYELRCMSLSFPQIGRYLEMHHTSVIYHLGNLKPDTSYSYPVPDESGVWAI